MESTAVAITPATMRAHRATWWAYTAPAGDPRRELIRRAATMRGSWPGHEVRCSCGWETRSGGYTRAAAAEALEDHRWDEQGWAVARDAVPCPDCLAEAGEKCAWAGGQRSTTHPGRYAAYLAAAGAKAAPCR
jgi:hypothetical protein